MTSHYLVRPENLANHRFVSSPAESHPVLSINLFIRTFKIEYWYHEQMDGPCFAAFKPNLGETWEEASSSNVCRCSFFCRSVSYVTVDGWQHIPIGLKSDGFITDHHYLHWNIEVLGHWSYWTHISMLQDFTWWWSHLMRYLLAHQMKFWSIETSMNLALDRGDNLGVPETSQRRLWDSVTDFHSIFLDQLWLCVVDMFRICSVS